MTSKVPSLTVFGDPKVGAYSWSPFVTKLEARLRYGHLPYSRQPGSPLKSPKGKIPYARIDEGDGKSSLISDSTLIAQTLIKSGAIEDLNADLSPSQAAQDLAIRALIEDKLYFLTMHERWIENFYLTRDQGPLSGIPYPIRVLLGNYVYRVVVRNLHGQGSGRYSPAERDLLRREVWTSLDALVGEANSRSGSAGWVLGGEKPTDADSTLYGFLAVVLTVPANPEATAIVKGLPNLVSYAERVHDAYFSDYEKWT